ncbi:MAG: hypothetical protein ACKVZH_18015 [Blastocatellia bacterium]
MNKRVILAVSCLLVIAAFVAGSSIASLKKSLKPYAGMQLEVINNLNNYGVTLEDASSLQFSSKLASFYSAPANLMNDLVKYSVIIRNQSPQRIMSLTIIWRFYPSAGAPIPQTFTFTALDNIFSNTASVNLIESSNASRGMSLLSRDMGLGGEFNRITEIKDDQYTQTLINRLNELLAQSVRWTVEIDGLLLSNGLYVGPDNAGFFNVLQSEIKGTRDLVAELAQKTGDPVAFFAQASTEAKVTKEALESKYPNFRERMRSTGYAYEVARQQLALRVMSERERLGDKAAIDFISTATMNQIALVRKTG